MINNLLQADGKFLNQTDFEQKFQVLTNLLEYGAVVMKVKTF